MIRIVKFPDAHAEIISALRKSLVKLGVTDVRVASKRLNEDQYSTLYKEVIVSRPSNRPKEKVLLESEFTIYVYVKNANESLSETGLMALESSVITALGFLKTNSKTIKIVEDVSSTPFEDTGITRVASILCTVTFIGTITLQE